MKRNNNGSQVAGLRGLRTLAVIFLIVAATCASAFANEKPNVIVILSDDQGYGDYGIHGNTMIHTPNLDRLALSGAQFDRFFVCSVCAPTRAEFLTGRHYTKTGVRGVSRGAERLNESETLISEIFSRAGYKTAAFGKWHNGSQYPYHPNNRGFDEFYGFGSGHWDNYFEPMLDHNGDLVKGEGYLTDDLTERAMAYIDSHHLEAPFFVYLALNTPHSPMQVPDQWWEKYKDMESTLEFFEKDRENLEHTRAAYAMVENIDWNVGRLLEKLDELDLTENTIVVYFNDNGPNGRRWNGGMLGRKGSIDEGGVRSALFVRWPDQIEAGMMIEEISSSFDLLPTLADLAEIEIGVTKPLDGVSLKPLLFESGSDWPERTFFHYKGGAVSVRTQRYRLDGNGMLYDMVEDGGQQQPINDLKPDLAAKFKGQADNWMKGAFEGKDVEDNRPFVIGHPDAVMTQIPARDGRNRGGILRSAKYPNASYFTNWKSEQDAIEWVCEVGESGLYHVEIFYTCSEGNVGSKIEMSFNESRLVGEIVEAHDPPESGMEHDRVKRKESYAKDWKRAALGEIQLYKGTGILKLQALEIPGEEVIDFRTLLLTRRN